MQRHAKQLGATLALVAGLSCPAAWAGEAANESLLKAARAGDQAGINQAMENGADISARNDAGRTALIIAARHATPEAVKALLGAGADVDAGATAAEKTALMGAARKGHTEIARVLTEAGADVNSRDQNGRTPLMVASKQGHREIMTILVRNGAEAETKDRFGWDVRDYAKMGGKETIKHFEQLNAEAAES